jgi:hypothetical protein
MPAELLSNILKQYLYSGDFNGYLFKGGAADAIEEAVKLVREGQAEVISEEDFPNPHIRPWPCRRSEADQVRSVLESAEHPICLYPTTTTLAKTRRGKRYPNEPYSKAMARGKGALELAHFRFAVLEQYRNDPTFWFNFGDFGAQAVAVEESGTDESDKIVMTHIGFAYDLSDYQPEDPASPITRNVCAFYRDLARLSPEHQLRWKSFELPSDSMTAHPVWMAGQMGEWHDGLGPFDKLFFELGALNELSLKICGQKLFRTSDRPEGFGWILRPSQREWDSFVHELDKLLSENLNKAALDALGAPTEDEQGQTIGTLNRLTRLLKSKVSDHSAVDAVMQPLKEVRGARQRPAHAIRSNINDQTFVHKQVSLIESVNSSLFNLRRFWQKHPSTADWQEPDYIANGQLYRT